MNWYFLLFDVLEMLVKRLIIFFVRLFSHTWWLFSFLIVQIEYYPLLFSFNTFLCLRLIKQGRYFFSHILIEFFSLWFDCKSKLSHRYVFFNSVSLQCWDRSSFVLFMCSSVFLYLFFFCFLLHYYIKLKLIIFFDVL